MLSEYYLMHPEPCLCDLILAIVVARQYYPLSAMIILTSVSADPKSPGSSYLIDATQGWVFTITVFFVISHVDLVSNATSNRYQDISSLRLFIQITNYAPTNSNDISFSKYCKASFLTISQSFNVSPSNKFIKVKDSHISILCPYNLYHNLKSFLPAVMMLHVTNHRHSPEKKTVMVCDDDHDLRQLFGQALRSKYNIILVGSGEDCIDRFKVTSYISYY